MYTWALGSAMPELRERKTAIIKRQEKVAIWTSPFEAVLAIIIPQ
jgi:hypothetical protein